MFPNIYNKLYSTPDFHKPPEDGELSADIEYPNENSRDYSIRPINRQIHMYDAWEAIAMNEDKEFVIATNKMCGREWCGLMWGFEQMDLPVEMEKAVYKLQCKSLISSVKFVAKNIVIMALYSGNLQVWSTRSEVRNPSNPYCLFQIGEKCEHERPILSLDVCKTNPNVAITGSKDGALKIWDMVTADLLSTHGYAFAHTDSITGIDSSHNDDSIFVTCSLDSTALYWDNRLPRPALSLLSDSHNVRFKDIKHADEEDKLIYIGDEAGYVHSVDLRQPNHFVNSTKFLDRPIRKLAPNGKNLAIIGDTNVVKIAAKDTNAVIYENRGSETILRDLIWTSHSELLTIGYESEIRKHLID